MHRQISLVITLFAWLLATGGHWDLVQTFAWGRMFVTNVQTMPVLAAVQKTFSADAKCAICKIVKHAKEQQEAGGTKSAGPKAPEKIFLVSEPAAVFCLTPAPLCAGLVPPCPAPSSVDPAAPLLTPPRGSA